MILDHESHRALLLQCIDTTVPHAVRDASPQSLANLQALSAVRADVEAASVAEADPAPEE